MDLHEADLRLSQWGNKLLEGVAHSSATANRPLRCHPDQVLPEGYGLSFSGYQAVSSNYFSLVAQHALPAAQTFERSSGSSASFAAAPTRRKSWAHSCDDAGGTAFGGGWAGDTASSWEAGKALQRRLSESIPRWLSGGGATVADAGLGVLDGTVVLRGTLEDQRLAELQDALAEALAKVLDPVAGLSSPWSCAGAGGGGAQDSAGAPCSVGVSRGSRSSAASAEFTFKVLLGDPNDLPAAAELLRLEARLGGAKRLLPQLMRSLGEEVAGHLSLRLDVAPLEDDPILVVAMPGTQAFA